jgi:hypothetical protein
MSRPVRLKLLNFERISANFILQFIFYLSKTFITSFTKLRSSSMPLSPTSCHAMIRNDKTEDNFYLYIYGDHDVDIG